MPSGPTVILPSEKGEYLYVTIRNDGYLVIRIYDPDVTGPTDPDNDVMVADPNQLAGLRNFLNKHK